MSYTTLMFSSIFLMTSLCAGRLGNALSAAEPTVAAKSSLRAPPEDVTRWRQLKFGMFIHWGPVSLQGTEIGWSRGGERRGMGPSQGNVPVEVYDNLYKKFNPTRFDPKQWVQTAKDAGMRYMVLTTRHHDGFSLFDTQCSDYKITSPESPYGKDVVKMLSEACRAGGLTWGVYYSQPDWHHPDYRTKNHKNFLKFLHGQVRELLSNYGRTDVIWFDGLGGKARDWDAEKLFQTIRSLQPQILINNRCGLPGDFDTPEQHIGNMQVDRPWETCMTIGTQWAWKPGDNLKSLKTCLHVLINTVGGDGNLLLNVGPMPDGRIEPRQARRLKEMGDWLAKYGESVYGTRGGPFWRGPWGAATQKGDTIYLHLLDPKRDAVRLPPIPKKILSHSVLTGGTASVQQTPSGIEVSVPPEHRREIDTIVVLKLDGPAAEIPVEQLRVRSVAKGKKAAASNVFQRLAAQYGPQNAFDGNPQTRWATDAGTHRAWLEVDLGDEARVHRAVIAEAYAPRVQAFEIQADQGDGWKTVYVGQEIGEDGDFQFPPVTARRFRLNILKAAEGPTLWEFGLIAAP
ncbi:MAG: alpha-L-fucosidase [Pirellulales bacterium]|nr:alpha-L-fucosidase [Pirellulales bacterium]